MAKSTYKKVVDAELPAPLPELPRAKGLMKFRVLTPVLGYNKGDEFEASLESVKRQLKHKSIEVSVKG